MSRLHRSISEPIRQGLNTAQRWHDEDRGLIYCWERGREMRKYKPELSEQAKRGELMPLAWRGGVEQKINGDKSGTFWYLATWQGLRGDDLSIDISSTHMMVCTRTGQVVAYSWQG